MQAVTTVPAANSGCCPPHVQHEVDARGDKPVAHFAALWGVLAALAHFKQLD